MTLKIFRRGSARCIGLLCAFATILLCLYYISIGQSSSGVRPGREAHHATGGGVGGGGGDVQQQQHQQQHNHRSIEQPETCQRLQIADTDITTMAEYSQFEFQVRWWGWMDHRTVMRW